MWNATLPSRSSSHLGLISPERILYEFEEPLIFTARLGFAELLFLKVSEIESEALYLATSIYPHILDAVESGSLSLRGAMQSGPCFIVQMADSSRVLRYWDCNPDDVPEQFLPKRGVGLTPGMGWVADTYEQIDAFFSVRFSGETLSRETMSFQTFKNLIDNVYESVRRMFAPSGLEKAKSATFDFRIYEPEFGSLIVNIENLELNPKNIRRHLKNKDVDIDDVRAGFVNKKDEFFREMEAVTEIARARELSNSDADEHFGVLKKVMGLLPGESTEFDKIEFSGAAGAKRQTIIIEGTTASRLRRAHDAASGVQKSLIGAIIITNSNSNTFVVRLDGGRQLTCHLQGDKFKILMADIRFRSESRVNVYGRLYRRSQRDYMELDDLPDFI